MTQVISGTRVAVVEPDQLPPFPQGLYQHVKWVQDEQGKFLINEGVVFKPMNFGAELGAYDAGWCEEPTPPLTPMERPDIDNLEANPFTHETVWTADTNECGDLTAQSRQEVRDRVLANFLRTEQVAAERQFAATLLDDLGAFSITPTPATSIKDAMGILTDAAAEVGVGDVYVHGRPYWALQEYGLFTADLQTTLGIQLVVGGGYVDGLGDTLVATTPVYGWRTSPGQLESLSPEENDLYSLTQRSVLFGYEKIIAAVTIS